MTITQALLVHLGEETMAVPLPNVDAVLRVPRQEVLVSSNEEVRYYRYMDHEYRIFHLGELLGFGRSEVDSPLLPMLLVRSADQRLALLVDGVEGSREVVIKSVGPQLSSIRWIAGATVLGDGRVVLILDVLTLMRINIAALHKAVPKPEHPLEKASAIPTVMVVDDSITVRRVTERLLKRQGWDVMTAKDGVDAVSQLQENIPDIMLLDVEMPRMDGFELATQVRNDERLKHIPIIMITSRTGIKHRERAARIGINRHLGKPFNETELLDNINELLSGSKL
jgi:chemosensory pili system protein ChpA (sensor histidine kinase/response regulator)